MAEATAAQQRAPAEPGATRETTYLEAIREALWEEMKTDDSVFILGEDVGVYGGAFKITEGFLDEFGPDRVIDTPISEAAIVGASIGASHMGFKPVAEMQFMDFVAPAFDMIVNFAAKVRYRTGFGAQIVIRGPVGAGARAGPFHSQSPESYFANVPGLKMVAPATAYDAKGLLRASIRDPDPVLYFEHKFLYRRIKEQLPTDEEILVPIGKARVHREGEDLSIITWGAMVYTAARAADRLAEEEGVSAEVLDLRSLRPVDVEAVAETARKTGRVLVLHEAPRFGGLAGEITAVVCEEAFEWLDAPVRRVTAIDTPVPYSPPLEDYYLPQVEDVLTAARWLLAY
ncbi:MAG: alpha-ketoacid dehydrogenase subunit beta [Candidatus Palauibacterales bacterium]|nr:alpha-ketoacid dehydrogenase subunit beta [Candidatus Palauibacterales bacterium]MDP2583450.1 alpha-ketoacid dehydrogenase subunit beta [Candidatus Palauibacterales bacterium]